MKILATSIYLFLFVSHIANCQSSGELILKGDKLIGTSENKFFVGFEIELDTIYTSIDSILLFRQLPRIGTINFRNKFESPTEYTLTSRAGFSQIMFRFKNNYYTLDNLNFGKESITFYVDDDPDVPVTKNDLKIITIAKSLLSSIEKWNKADDRVCNDDLSSNSYSLYCALRIASLEVEERYNHRNAVLQKLRHLIEEKYPGRKWNHRLMDFNNMEATSHEDVLNILNEIEEAFILSLQERR